MACEHARQTLAASDVALWRALSDAPGRHPACSQAFSSRRLAPTQSGNRAALTVSREPSLMLACEHGFKSLNSIQHDAQESLIDAAACHPACSQANTLCHCLHCSMGPVKDGLSCAWICLHVSLLKCNDCPTDSAQGISGAFKKEHQPKHLTVPCHWLLGATQEAQMPPPH